MFLNAIAHCFGLHSQTCTSCYDDPAFVALHGIKNLLMFVFASRMGNDWWKILLPLQRLRYESILAPHLYPIRWFIDHLISCSTPPGSKFGRIQIWVMYNIWRWTFTLYGFVLF